MTRPAATRQVTRELTNDQPVRTQASEVGTPSSGFTMIELLVVVAVLGIVSVITVPMMFRQIERSKTMGFLAEVRLLLQQARQESIRRGVDAVVLLDPANQRVFAFANVDGDADSNYNPDPLVTNRTVDYEIGQRPFVFAGGSPLLMFWGPDDATPDAEDSTEGLSLINGCGDGDAGPACRAVIFQSDGSVRDAGGIRFGIPEPTADPLNPDPGQNFFELRIEPAATARVELLKYNWDPGFGPEGFYPRGFDPDSGEALWRWYR